MAYYESRPRKKKKKKVYPQYEAEETVVMEAEQDPEQIRIEQEKAKQRTLAGLSGPEPKMYYTLTEPPKLIFEIRYKTDLENNRYKHIQDFAAEYIGTNQLPGEGKLYIYYKNQEVAHAQISYSAVNGYSILLNPGATLLENVPEHLERNWAGSTPTKEVTTENKTAEKTLSRYELDKNSLPVLVIKSLDPKKPVTVNEAYQIIADEKLKNTDIKKQYPKQTASETNNGKTAPQFTLDGKYIAYYFPDKTIPEEKNYQGEPVNRSALVKAEDGIRLHKTPNTADKEYVNKTENAQTVYPKNTKVYVLYKSDEENKDWLNIRIEDKEGWIEERFINIPLLKSGINKVYTVKHGDTPTSIVQQIIDIKKTTGYDDRTLVHALYLMNKDRGVRINQEKYLNSFKENKLLNTTDPGMAETRAVYQSAVVVLNADLVIPSKADLDRLIGEGKIGSRPDWMNLVIEGGKSVIGFQKGYYEGLYEAGKEAVEDTIKLIRDILSGDIIQQAIDLVKELLDLGPAGIWEAIKEMVGGTYNDFITNWNNPNPEKRWEYIGKISGMIAFEVGIAIITAGAGNYIKSIPKVKKVLDKLPKLKNVISKKAPELEKKSEVMPITGVNKADDILLARYQKLRKELSKLSKEEYEKFDKYLRTLPEDVLKKLDAEPELVESFAKQSLKDAEFAEAVRKGNINKLEKSKQTLIEKGSLTGSLDKLTTDERRVVENLINDGKNIKIIPRSDKKTADFLINGVKTELKTLQNPNHNTAITRIQDAFAQGKAVILDTRKTSLTKKDAQEIIHRATNTFKDKKLPGRVEIWTIEGKFVF